ncbi:MAG: DUF975 family protein [Oscillospiraceae bacterium]|jgi:uncharacterized membrane protein|nr:DUF975 family protein [Oscillospiraceae bacterium]
MQGSVLKAGARKLIFDNSPKLLFISLVYVFLATVVSWLSFRLPGSLNMQDINSRLISGELPGFGIIYTGFRPIGAFLALLLLLLQPVLDVGFMSICLKTGRIQAADYKDLFDGFLFFTKVISIFIITVILIFLWSLLLFIPGIIASYKYRQAYYILLDDPNKSALQCINESRLLMHGHKLDLFLLDISFIGWYLLDLVVIMLIPLPFAVPVVSVWLAPYIGLSRAAFYDEKVENIAA